MPYQGARDFFSQGGPMKVPNAMLRRVLVTLQMIIGPLVAVMLLTGEATSADIRVFSGGGPQDALRHLAPEFERATGHHVEFTFQLVTEIQRKLAAGEEADVIVLPVPLIAATAKTVPLRTEGRIVLARVGIAVIVRQGTTPPDISTAEAVRKMLLNARAIAWSDPSTPVGGSLNRAIAQLGIADEVRPKLIITSAIHGGADLVAKGEADFWALSPQRSANGQRYHAGGIVAPSSAELRCLWHGRSDLQCHTRSRSGLCQVHLGPEQERALEGCWLRTYGQSLAVRAPGRPDA
jgi:molybdate transport system substrate-binding protein